MKEQNIEQLFQNRLSNFEADVSPDSWTNIEQGIHAPVKEISKSTTGARSGLPVYGGLLLTVAAVGIMTAIYFDTRKSASDVNALMTATPAPKENPASAVQHIQSPVTVTEAPKIAAKQVPVAKLIEQNTTKQGSQGALKKNSIAESKVDAKTNVAVPANNAPVKKESHPAIASDNKSSVKVNEEKIIWKEESVSSGNSLPIPIPQQSKPAVEEGGNPDAAGVSSAGETGNIDFFIPGAFTIFDAKGNQVFSGSDASRPWDGTLKDGQEAARAFYTYIMVAKDLSDKVHTYRGKIALMRNQ
jgi:hypothetical protein